jgi:hypothetical protein
MILYRARMTESEEGIGIWYDKWKVIYETEYFYMCISEYTDAYVRDLPDEEVILQYKKNKRKFKRIAKRFSRFAFGTKKEALESLIIKKKAQLNHCRRNLAVVGRFVADVEDKIENYLGDNPTIEGTKEIINEWYIFN